MLGQADCSACALLTLDLVHLGVQVYKNPKDKKKEKCDKPEKGNKLVNPSSVTVIGSSTSVDKMDSNDISLTKAPNLVGSSWILKTSFLLASPD